MWVLFMFRANEDSEKLRVKAFDYLLMKDSFPWRKENSGTISTEDRNRAEHALTVIHEKFGPFVTSYPEWHPVIALGLNVHNHSGTQTTPCFPHLDHTSYMANAIITCPYGSADELIATVKRSYWGLVQYLNSDDGRYSSMAGWLRMAADSIELRAAYITAELIESFVGGNYDYDDSDVSNLIPMYAQGARPILIWWSWNNHQLEPDGTISPAIAVPLMLSRTLADLSYAEFHESWEDMRYLLLGSPHGARSSLLLNQLTVKQLRTMFNGLMESGAFGPPKNK